jgi:hypothetical protein
MPPPCEPVTNGTHKSNLSKNERLAHTAYGGGTRLYRKQAVFDSHVLAMPKEIEKYPPFGMALAALSLYFERLKPNTGLQFCEKDNLEDLAGILAFCTEESLRTFH